MAGENVPTREALRRDLCRILPEDQVLTADEDLTGYRNDASWFKGQPDAVVLPTSTEEVKKCLAYAYSHDIPIIPRGSGTGLSGGVVPLHGGIVFDLGRMNKIIEIDTKNLTATVQPGVITGELHRAVEKLGLFYPPDPATLTVCTIGGNVATRAGGPRGVKYGTTKDYVLGLEAVVPPGEVIRAGGRTVKFSAGYEIGRLFVGSEGTLGIITEIILKLIPLPPAKKTMLVSFATIEAAAETVVEIISRAIVPTTLEIMDKKTLQAVQAFRDVGYPTDVEGLLIIEVDGSERQVAEDMEVVERVCREMGAIEIKVAKDQKEADALWTGRRSMMAAFAHMRPTLLSEDVTVPRSKVPAMVKAIREISARYNIELGLGGHVGDGNMHPNFLLDKRNREEFARAEKVMAEVAQAAVDMGGVVSGEHGIGIAKAEYLRWQCGDLMLHYMREIKKVFDPKGLMNPGKIWWEQSALGTPGQGSTEEGGSHGTGPVN